MKGSFPVHEDEIFKMDMRHYCQVHRKVRTSYNAGGVATECGFKIKRVK